MHTQNGCVGPLHSFVYSGMVELFRLLLIYMFLHCPAMPWKSSFNRFIVELYFEEAISHFLTILVSHQKIFLSMLNLFQRSINYKLILTANDKALRQQCVMTTTVHKI